MRVLFTDNEENCSQDKVLMEDREFEAGNILMAVPLDFQEMEEWRKAALYPWEKRPELISLSVYFFVSPLNKSGLPL